MAAPPRILLEGRPGVGKTTVARGLASLLGERGIALAGFTTQEIREDGRRVGFGIETMSGERGVLAHIDLPGPPRVGKYGVDIAAFERVALPALRPSRGATIIVDEIGKMELASTRFREAVSRLFGSRHPVVATIHAFRHPFTDAFKAQADLDVVRVTRANRDGLPRDLAERLSRER